jgi:DNA-binding response OmpR family regulator
MSPNGNGSLLIVDDDPTNRFIMRECLSDQGCAIDEAEDGASAWRRLLEAPDRYDTVLLDRMMPDMDGLEILRRMKVHPALSGVPVILQTAAAGTEQVIEGLQAGAFYYLTKPFSPEILQAIVRTAIRDRGDHRSLVSELARMRDSFELIEHAKFRFRTLDEARNLAALAASGLKEAAQTAMGLSELMINAVEHGNLGISYADKSRMLLEGRWGEEIESRMRDPRYAGRFATLGLERRAEQIEFTVTDMGDGFDWQRYLDLHPSRIMDLHGRGIAIARRVCFDDIRFEGCGNVVTAIKRL